MSETTETILDEKATYKVVIKTTNNLTITMFGTEETVDKMMNYFEKTNDKVYRIINTKTKDDTIINPAHVVCILKEVNNDIIDRIKEKISLSDRVKEEIGNLLKKRK